MKTAGSIHTDKALNQLTWVPEADGNLFVCQCLNPGKAEMQALTCPCPSVPLSIPHLVSHSMAVDVLWVKTGSNFQNPLNQGVLFVLGHYSQVSPRMGGREQPRFWALKPTLDL